MHGQELHLFSATAAADDTVPPAAARALHAALAPRYAAAPERLRYLEVPGAGHVMPERAWRGIWEEAPAWLAGVLGR